MSAVNRDTIEHIARLSRLQVNEEMCDQFAKQLSRILDLVAQMNRIDTEVIVPMAHPQDVHLRLRPDQVTTKNHREEYQALAPEAKDGLYLVPRVIE